MADKQARNQQYDYKANSNLVITSNRADLPRRDHEPTGEPETLVGRINPKDFGSRAVRERPDVKKAEKKGKKDKEGDEPAPRSKKSGAASAGNFGFSSVLAATDDFDGLSYRPRTKETRAAYEFILDFVQNSLGDQPQDILKGAADEALATLKTDSLKDLDKKRNLETLLGGTIAPDAFSQILNISKKITDYSTQEELEAEKGEADANEQQGVAVVFDEDEGNEEEEGDQFVVGEDGDEDDEEELQEGQDGSNAMDVDDESLRAGGPLRTVGEANADEGRDNEEEDANELTRSTTIALKGSRAGQSKKTQGSTAELNVHDIDAFWLQRQVSAYYKDAHQSQELSTKILAVLEGFPDQRECENQLVLLLEYERFDLVKVLLRNRWKILFCTKLARAQDVTERETVLAEISQRPEAQAILRELQQAPALGEKSRDSAPDAGARQAAARISASERAHEVSSTAVPKANLDLENLAFQQGGHFMSNKKLHLPAGSVKIPKKNYEEIHVPPPARKPLDADERLVQIADLPEWAQPAFRGIKELNRIQSRLYEVAFNSSENVLLCSPTGGGKTNVALLTMVREIGQNLEADGILNLDNFKIVYIAPMKALVQEVVGNFTRRLEPYKIKVAELTGDRQLTKQQIAETQVIVTTPEKWDIITRKATDRSYTALVRLIIIDEIHLLHDERGPVLESVVARTIRNMEQTQEPVRLVGLSATLPNYQDAAAFLRVDFEKGLHFFDNSYRPCPLHQQYIGIMEKKAIKRFQLMNEITYEKVMEQAGKNQVLIFVHSRKETVKTAKAIRDMAIEKDTIGQFMREDSASREILREQAETVKNSDLADLLRWGFAVHHAGMTRADRVLVEELFDDGHVQVLVSTATLAWGVNLPAHTVIIKGTQIYNPEKGRWVELSHQDVLQMLGRAGRPNRDTSGEGIVITSHQELQYYLSLLNQQLPIESQYISRLADNLNAEIVLGTVRNREDAVEWLGYTYLYVRMLRDPHLYGVSADDLKEDRFLKQRRVDLIHAAALQLDKCNLIKYDKRGGGFQSTELGRIASHYYVTHGSMATYNTHLKPTMSQIDLFRVFSLSHEFRFIPVREEEKLELQKLVERVPIPVKESIEEPTAKINILLQAYISQLRLEGFALVADMVYITQSANRILRAVFEICLRQGWAQLTEKALDLCKMVDRRMWLSMSPLRQFKGINAELIKKLERKEFPWERYFDLDPQQLSELIKIPKLALPLHKMIHQFPKLDLQAQIQPITHSLLRMELIITPDFEFDEKIHGNAETFWVMVVDCDEETILHQEQFILKKRYASEEHHASFTVPIYEPLPPNIFVNIVSDRWIMSSTKLAVSFKHLILPERFPPNTEVLDLQPLPVSALRNKEYEKLYDDQFTHFNPIQTQVFSAIYLNDENVFVGASTGSGKTVCAEFALLRLWSKTPDAKAVYVVPFQEQVDIRFAEWRKKFARLGKVVVSLTGETSADLKLIDSAQLILTTPPRWDTISRRWRTRKTVQQIALYIADEMHLIGGEQGPTYEIIVSRMRYVAAQTENKSRIIVLSCPIANAVDIGRWIGAAHNNVFNFRPDVRPVPLEIFFQAFNIPHFASFMMALSKPVFHAITTHSPSKPAIVYVPSRKQSKITTVEIMNYAIATGNEHMFLRCDFSDIEPYMVHIKDAALQEALQHGIAFYHEVLTNQEKAIVKQLFEAGAIQVLVVSRDACWGLSVRSHLVVVMGTQYYDGQEHRYVDYPIADILQMIGAACRPKVDYSGKCVVLTHAGKKEYYKKFLHDALPVESHLDHHLHDHFNAEIVTKTIETTQDAVDYFTWTFLFPRMAQNPNYYNLSGNTREHLSDHLSELVENTLNDLSKSNCIKIEDKNLSPLNLGMIAAFYNISYTTIDVFSLSLTNNTKIKGLLEIISAASEFDNLVIRHHEDIALSKVYDRLPVKLAEPRFTDPHVKTNILIQAHLSRVQLPTDLETDQRLVLGKVISLIQACVNVISSNDWLKPALAAMELSQMIVQAMWDQDSPLKQLPHFNAPIIERFKRKGVTNIFEFMEMEDDERSGLMALPPKQAQDVALATNRYPNIEVQYEVEDPDEIETGAEMSVEVQLKREEESDPGAVIAPFYPGKKDEGWWLVIGEPKTNILRCIKRLTVGRSASAKLEFTAPKQAGVHKLTLYFMCDAYVGCDQEYEIEIDVKQAAEEDDEDEEDAEEDEE